MKNIEDIKLVLLVGHYKEDMTKIKAINHVVKNKNGYLNDLKHKIGENNLKALLQIGFITRGKEISNKDSWKVTKFAVDFVNNMNKKISIFDRFRYFINSKIDLIYN